MHLAAQPIPDNEAVVRLIKPGAKYQGNPPDHLITPANFVRRPLFAGKEPGLSVSRLSLVTKQQVLDIFLHGNAPTGHRFAESTVGDIRAITFEVHATPSLANAGHASIKCMTCNLANFGCLLAGDEDCELEDLQRRSELADLFMWSD